MTTMTLPMDSAARKEYPMSRGLLAYFPAALAGVAHHSKVGNDKHNPGAPMHHSRNKSGDHADCIVRHLVDFNDLIHALRHAAADCLACSDQDAPYFDQRHDELRERVLDEVNALAWRALALSQETHEDYGGSPLAPGARFSN